MRRLIDEEVEMFSAHYGHGGTYSDDNLEPNVAAILRDFVTASDTRDEDVPFSWCVDESYSFKQFTRGFFNGVHDCIQTAQLGLPNTCVATTSHRNAFNDHSGVFLTASTAYTIFMSDPFYASSNPFNQTECLIPGLDSLWANILGELCSKNLSS